MKITVTAFLFAEGNMEIDHEMSRKVRIPAISDKGKDLDHPNLLLQAATVALF